MKLRALYLSAIVAMMASCGGSTTETEGSEETELTGTINIDGSSTVFPISGGMAELFGDVTPEVKVLVGQSGTGGGFSKFSTGETQINDASRQIKEKEAQACVENNITYTELMVAYDGISIVVNKENTWVDYLTTEELKKIWQNTEDKAMTWADVRAGWPAEQIKLYGPGTASGTYDYFNEEILGKELSPRADYNSSENDRMLVKGVQDDKNALGYFGFGYYAENKETLKIVPVDAGKGAIAPSMETIMNKSYAPLSRPLFIYVNSLAKERKEIQAFVKFYLENSAEVAEQVGFIPMTEKEIEEQKKAFDAYLSEK